MSQSKSSDSGTIMKANWSSLLVFCLMMALPIFSTIVSAVLDPTTDILVLLILEGCIAGSVAAWLLAFRIKLNCEGVEFRTLTKGRVYVPFETIVGIKEISGWSNYFERFKPNHRLIIESFDGEDQKKIVINLKLLGKANIAQLRSALKKVD